MTSSSRARISTRRRRRCATSTSSSSACFSSAFRRSEPAMRWLSAPGSSMLATASCSSSGRYGTSRRSRVNVCWTLRVSASSSVEPAGTTSGSSAISATRYGVSRTQRVDAHALAALDEDPQRPVGHLEHARDRADDADVVEVVRAGRLVLGVARGDHHEHAVAAQDVVDERDRALLADRERDQRVGQRHRLAQRQDRQRARARRAARRPRRRAPRRRRRSRSAGSLPLQHVLAARPRSARCASRLSGCDERQLDAQDAVAVGRAGARRRRRRRRAGSRGGTGPKSISSCW